MFSVLIILSGILWIIFTQVDRSYDYTTEFSNLQQEHSELVQKVYQLQPKQQQPTTFIPEPAEVQMKAMAEIELKNAAVERTAITSVPSTSAHTHNYEEWSNPAVFQSFESAYSLRNNPWSPDYKPGH